MTTDPGSILSAALAASGLTVGSPDAPSAPAVGLGAAGTSLPSPSPVPSPSEPPAAPAPSLTPDQLAALAAQHGQVPLAPGAQAPTGRSALMQTIIDRFGSEEAFAQSLIDQGNGAAALHQRLDALIEKVDRPSAILAPFDAAADPEVKFHSDQLDAVIADLADQEAIISKAVQTANVINTKLTAKQTEVSVYRKASMSDEAAQAQHEVDQLQRDYEREHRVFTAANGEAKNLRRTKLEIEFRHRQAVGAITERHQALTEAEKQDRADKSVFYDETNSRFDAALVKHATRYGVAPSASLRGNIVSRFDRFVAALPVDHDRPVNLDWFVGAAMDAEAKQWGISQRSNPAEFMERARQVAAATGVALTTPAQPTAPAQPVPGTTLESLSLADQNRAVREHARRILTQPRRA